MEPNNDDNVRKVYISDSPVEDNVEYNYVSLDVEEELQKTEKIVTREKTPAPVLNNHAETDGVMAPHRDLVTEEDELAKEAEYQRELQDRLQKASISNER